MIFIHNCRLNVSYGLSVPRPTSSYFAMRRLLDVEGASRGHNNAYWATDTRGQVTHRLQQDVFGPVCRCILPALAACPLMADAIGNEAKEMDAIPATATHETHVKS